MIKGSMDIWGPTYGQSLENERYFVQIIESKGLPVSIYVGWVFSQSSPYDAPFEHYMTEPNESRDIVWAQLDQWTTDSPEIGRKVEWI